MIKRMQFFVMVLIVGSGLQATWKLGKIYNYSTLNLASAFYPHRNPARPDKPVHRLTTVLQAADKKTNQKTQPVVIDISYPIHHSAKGFDKMVATNGYELLFEDNPVQHLRAGRSTSGGKKVKHHNVAKNLASSSGNLAQVYLYSGVPQPKGSGKELVYTTLRYEQNDKQSLVELDLYLFNKGASYAMKLMPAPKKP